MSKPKFKIGQLVLLSPRGFARNERYVVIKVLRAEDGEFYYRIRDRAEESQELIVKESELLA